MTMIEWNPRLATGIDEIDDQHKELFHRVDLLMIACSTGKGRDEVARILEFLGAYVRIHFESEEQIQIETGYPDLEAHRLAHEGFIRQIERLKHHFAEEGASLSLIVETNHAAVEWLTSHISVMDKALAEHIRQRVSPHLLHLPG